jgi:hypothetical protein
VKNTKQYRLDGGLIDGNLSQQDSESDTDYDARLVVFKKALDVAMSQEEREEAEALIQRLDSIIC